MLRASIVSLAAATALLINAGDGRAQQFGTQTVVAQYVPAPPQSASPEGAAPPGAPPQIAQEQSVTPPRLSLVDGPASFWRPGADDWAAARVNTPLAAGDSLYTASGGNIELQIGPRAFVRAGDGTQLQLTALEPDYMQFRVSAGQASIDLRELGPGQTVEVDTPAAAFTIERVGYYRFSVVGESSALITRRGGSAVATLANGQTTPVSASEEVIVQGDTPSAAVYAAPDLDPWDRWNYSRTDYLVDAMSARYVPPGVYGAADLDHAGSWRTVPDYGPVWIPSGMQPGWAPYSTGHWVYDPVFGWSWVDDAAWGWVPFHYGRWVSVGGFWAWAPGPALVRPVYAPALVAWLGGGPGVGVGAGVAWVALGWGEPIRPWWGPREFIGRPRWDGWGGPRVVNNVVINNVTNIDVGRIAYANTHVRSAVVATNAEQMAHGTHSFVHVTPQDLQHWHPAEHGGEVHPTAAAMVAGADHAVRPPKEFLERSVVARREPHEPMGALHTAGITPTERPGVLPRAVGPTVVPKPQPGERTQATIRMAAPDGSRPGEMTERHPPEPLPAYNAWRAQQTNQSHFAAQPGQPGAAPHRDHGSGPAPNGRPDQTVNASRPEYAMPNAAPRADMPRPQPPASPPRPMVAERPPLPGEPAMQVHARPQPGAVPPPGHASAPPAAAPAAPHSPSPPAGHPGGGQGHEHH